MNLSRRLIGLVRANPLLYDPAHPSYMDTEFRNKIWDEIGEELGITGQVCKSKWGNMRDMYRRSLKKLAALGGSKLVKMYKYSNDLGFLKKYFGDIEKLETWNSAIGDVDKNQDYSVEENDIIELFCETQQFNPEEDNIINEESQYPTLSETEKGASLHPNRSKKRKLSPSPPSSPHRSLTEAVVEYLLRDKQRKDSTRSPDPVDAFLAGIAPPLKTLSPNLWHHARGEIFAVVQKYDIQMIKGKELK